jgi:hypothetical protein
MTRAVAHLQRRLGHLHHKRDHALAKAMSVDPASVTEFRWEPYRDPF